jgi:hypothetical protein
MKLTKEQQEYFDGRLKGLASFYKMPVELFQLTEGLGDKMPLATTKTQHERNKLYRIEELYTAMDISKKPQLTGLQPVAIIRWYNIADKEAANVASTGDSEPTS